MPMNKQKSFRVEVSDSAGTRVVLRENTLAKCMYYVKGILHTKGVSYKIIANTDNKMVLYADLDNPLTPSTFIKELRRFMGISQATMGKLLLVAPKTIMRWESGKHRPPESVFLFLSQL